MKIYSIICTRSKELNPVTKALVDKLSTLPAKVMLMVNQESIFSGYKKAFEKVNPKDNDIFILCHDDIELPQAPHAITQAISIVTAPNFGFAGVAGTKLLGEEAVWWDQKKWKDGHHSGEVWHPDATSITSSCSSKDFHQTYYGPLSKVVVLDGLFLAASARTLRQVGLEKPSYLIGDWDFYDIHYTFSAFKKGLSNVTVPIKIAHHSRGELVGRDGWNENRQAFIRKHALPARI
jgi:hypothetical protein